MNPFTLISPNPKSKAQPTISLLVSYNCSLHNFVCERYTQNTILSVVKLRRGRKLINKLEINKLEKYKFFHVGKNNSHPRKNEKMDLTFS